MPQGLAYGAGLSRGLTPTFFLGELLEERRVGELTILILGPELARDLDASPALCQGTLIYARRQALAFYLWDHLSDPTQQGNAYLQLALKAYHLTLKDLLSGPRGPPGAVQRLSGRGVGSGHPPRNGRSPGAQLARRLPRGAGTLPPDPAGALGARPSKTPWPTSTTGAAWPISSPKQRLPSLAVMLAWRPGLIPALLPELEPAFQDLLATGDWAVMDAARRQALTRLREMAAGLNTLLEAPEAASAAWLQDELHRRYLAPLGL